MHNTVAALAATLKRQMQPRIGRGESLDIIRKRYPTPMPRSTSLNKLSGDGVSELLTESNVVRFVQSDSKGGNFLNRHDRRWFTIDVISGNIYHIYIDDEHGSGLYSADEELFVYEGEPSDLREYVDHVDVYIDDEMDVIGLYDKPYDYKANFTGQLYILLISDNPGYQTFEIRYEVN